MKCLGCQQEEPAATSLYDDAVFWNEPVIVRHVIVLE
jgi:hypothetical protein